jgi:hypothetical protein
MRRLSQGMLILGLLCCVLSGCGPTYGYYGDRGYGYAPYSYGLPIYAHGYAPGFGIHHGWEDHHMGGGHHESFGGGHMGGFGGGGHGGGFGGGGHGGGFGGGGHGGGGHR